MSVFWYQGEKYELFLSEYELLNGKEAGENEYFTEQEDEEKEQIEFRVEEYRLFLERKSGSLLTQEAVKYSGGILIVKDCLEEYAEYEDMYSYETVLELIFKDGCLMTSVDHSKAVLRIRRNLEQGLRNLNRARDRHCIYAFMHRAVICDYRQSRYAYNKRKLLRNIRRGTGMIKRKVFKKK